MDGTGFTGLKQVVQSGKLNDGDVAVFTGLQGGSDAGQVLL